MKLRHLLVPELQRACNNGPCPARWKLVFIIFQALHQLYTQQDRSIRSPSLLRAAASAAEMNADFISHGFPSKKKINIKEKICISSFPSCQILPFRKLRKVLLSIVVPVRRAAGTAILTTAYISAQGQQKC